MGKRILFGMVLLVAATAVRGAEARDLDALQKEFLRWKFGMFIHFNMSTFVPGGWSTGKEDPALFNPVGLDMGQWADAAKSAHMKYGVLTVKHTGGYCLWDSACTDHDMTMFKNYKNGRGDLVQEFCDAFRSRDLKVGLYYCFPLWSAKWANYSTLPLDGYETGATDSLAFIKNQFTELLGNYGKIDLIWIDQSNTLNGGMKAGDWQKFKAHVHALQPDCLVIANNQSDYNDTDIHGDEYPYSLALPPVGNPNPAEVCDKLQQGWFLGRPTDSGEPVRDVDYVVNKMLRPANDNNANYLLNCTPDTRGLMPDSVVALLREVGQAWDPNEPSQAALENYGMMRAALSVIPNDHNQIALTFAPSADVSALERAAEVLSTQNVSGTFFVNDAALTEGKSAIKALAAQGHEIGNASKRLLDLTQLENGREVRNEIEPIQQAVHSLTKSRPTAFSASGHAYNENVWLVLNYQGMAAIEPEFSIHDAESTTRVTDRAHSGAIIEIVLNDATLQMLEPLVVAIKEKGWKPVTVRQLMAGSSSKRIRLAVPAGGSNVESGME